MTCVEVGSDYSQFSFHLRNNLVAMLAASFHLLSLQLVWPLVSFSVGDPEWTFLSYPHISYLRLLTRDLAEENSQVRLFSSCSPETRSRVGSEAPLRNSCFLLLGVGFVPGLWDAVFSNVQSLSCFQEVLSQLERSYCVRIPWLQATEDSTDSCK